MAEVKIKLCTSHSCCNKGIFTLEDGTGPYDATLNPYGWGVGNIELSEVTSSGLTVTSPNGIVYGPYDILATLPNLDGTTLTVDVTDILDSGEGEAYSDGYWQFDWTVQGDYGGTPTPFHARCVKQPIVLCDVECCVDTLMSNADPNCGCSKTGNKKAVNAMLTLEAIKARDNKKEREGAKARLADLQDICANNCKNC